ncbi:MAG: hypothetical protein Q7S22_07700 [Candidatus Micrarchaeota archaeon]|nr:hypothetical protein [Candidatus Micrarchaeota archaeon]
MSILTEFGRIRKEPTACGAFGAIAIKGGRGFVRASQAKDAIEAVTQERGGAMGNGISLSHPSNFREETDNLLLIWTKDETTVRAAEMIIYKYKEVNVNSPLMRLQTTTENGIWMTCLNGSELEIMKLVLEINGSFDPADLRVISSAKHQLVIKDLETLGELSVRYELDNLEARAIIAHTRYPTSAEPLATRAHPHAFGNVSMVYNGDVKSYLANLRATEAVISESLYPLFQDDTKLEQFMEKVRKSWVGSDAEVIAAPIYLLLQKGMSIRSILTSIAPPFDNYVATLPRGPERERLRKAIDEHTEFQLDGAVSAIATITTKDDVQLVAFRDRNEFRPLQVLNDRSERIVYVGSEIRQLEAAAGKSIAGENVESYSLDPDNFLWVSAKNGVIQSGRERRIAIAVPNAPEPNGTLVFKGDGKPGLFSGDRRNDERIAVGGTSGNALGNFTMGGHYRIFGSLQDNSFEGSRAKSVIVHANVGMMTPNAFQGERFYILGSGDSRCLQQTRHSVKTQPPPVGIVGEKAGTHFGKMNAGGILMVLGIAQIGHEEDASPLVGRLALTGMMDGTAYIRGRVPREYIGNPPSARRVVGEIKELKNKGMIDAREQAFLSTNVLDLDTIEWILRDNPDALARLTVLFSSKHQKPYDVQFRELDGTEHAFLDPHLDEFCNVFKLEPFVVETLKTSAYTVVKLKE